MAANNPRHGEAIIKVVTDATGGKKLIASDQFQAFLDQLGVVVNSNQAIGDLEQLIYVNNRRSRTRHP